MVAHAKISQKIILGMLSYTPRTVKLLVLLAGNADPDKYGEPVLSRMPVAAVKSFLAPEMSGHEFSKELKKIFNAILDKWQDHDPKYLTPPPERVPAVGYKNVPSRPMPGSSINAGMVHWTLSDQFRQQDTKHHAVINLATLSQLHSPVAIRLYLTLCCLIANTGEVFGSLMVAQQLPNRSFRWRAPRNNLLKYLGCDDQDDRIDNFTGRTLPNAIEKIVATGGLKLKWFGQNRLTKRGRRIEFFDFKFQELEPRKKRGPKKRDPVAEIPAPTKLVKVDPFAHIDWDTETDILGALLR
ncbi:RepB family plasmid replication initiator protein [Bradyrhizobium sp. S69]|uniref:replication initiation protein n=1 Tax=Bradyrhizobium sp. S69 TaxID=1641856 RepID=UPI00131A9462|nr:RepB family plasmid replication initiator protein [Bradyrhizobium sp. S69]